MKKSVKFKDIVGQNEAINILKFLIAKNMIYKPLLMIGVDGVGKEHAALAFVATYNCENNISSVNYFNYSEKIEIEKNTEACGSCRTCKMIAKGFHPDVFHMDFLDATNITISDIKHLLSKLSMKPCESRHKFVIIPKAQRMSSEASNALLRFLEENHEKATVILTAQSQMDLTPTVVSHCHGLRFKPMNYGITNKFLVNKNLNSKEIRTILNLSFGNLVKVKNFSSKIWNDKRRWLISKMSYLFCNTSISKNKKEWILLSEILSRCKDLDTINDFLLVINIWLRDILVYKFDPKIIYNLDMEKSIAMASKSIEHNDILNKINSLQVIQQDILKSNGNLNLLIDIMFIWIQELLA